MKSVSRIPGSLILAIALINLTVFPAITAKESTSIQTANQKKWSRRLAKSPSSDSVPMLVYLLDRYGRNVTDKTKFDRAVEEAMAKGNHRRATAARLVRNFKAIPLTQRQAVFGKFADPTSQTFVPEQIRKTIMNSLRTSRADRAAKQPVIPDPPLRKTEKGSRSERAEPPPSPEEDEALARSPSRTSLASRYTGDRSVFRPTSFRLTSFSPLEPVRPTPPVAPVAVEPLQIRYLGLYCREEADYDQGSNADEIYFITSVIDVARATSEGSPMNHPTGSHDYSGMDTGEIREGPVVSVYTGPPKDLTLIVTMMEFDFGNPDEFRDEVRVVVDVALAAIGAAVGTLGGVAGIIIGAAIGAGIGELIVDLINGLLDTEDDLIEVTNVFLSADDLSNMYRQALRDRRGDRDEGRGRATIQYHFSTRHNENEGADYFALFRVHDPNLHPMLPPPSAEVAPADLVVTRLEATGPPVVTATRIEVPFLVEVRNQGVAPAAIFKIAVDYKGRAADFINVPFTVPGDRDPTYPFSRTTLSSSRSTVFAGRLMLPLSERGTRVAMRAFADSCGGDEFLPDYCRVRESDERNNQSRMINVTLPR